MSVLSRIVLLAPLSFLLTGCFEVSEDIVIRKDESAQIDVAVTVSGSLAMLASNLDKSTRDPFGDTSKVVRDLEAIPGVTDVKHVEKKEGTKRSHRLVIELEHYQSLASVGEILMKYQRDRLLDTSFSIQEVAPSSMRVTQRLVGHQVKVKAPVSIKGMPIAPMMEGKEGEAREYIMGRLADKYVFVTLRAPAIGDHNGELNKSGTVVSWNVPLAAILESVGKPVDLAADISFAKDERPLWKRLLFFWR
jgi:hypothetical protein